MNQVSRALISGLGWGTIATGIGGRELGPWSILLVIAGAPIGLFIYEISKWTYRQRHKVILVVWSVASLYLSTALWGATEGRVHRIVYGPLSGWNLSATGETWNGAFICCYGLTVGWFLWPLFALAAANHVWLMRKEPSYQGRQPQEPLRG